MSTTPDSGDVIIRRLWRHDMDDIRAHFARLSPAASRTRFGIPADEEFLERYAGRIMALDAVIYGAYPDGALRAVGELRGLFDEWPSAAEAAFTVEEPWQDRGIGDALLTRIIAAAQNRGVRSLHMMCLRENEKMQHLAVKHHAHLDYHHGEVEAQLSPPWPTPFSLAAEIGGEAQGFVEAVLRWG